MGTGPAEFCQIADDRVLVQMDDDAGNRKFRDLICLLVEDLGLYRDVALDVEGAFDVTTALGEQLDMIGSVIDLPREGWNDTDYRKLLQIRIELLLSALRDDAKWTGTAENILTIARKFVGPLAPPIQLINVPPYNFTLTVSGLAYADAILLFRFICIAVYAGVMGYMSFSLAPGGLWDSDSVGPIPDAATWCSDSVAVPGCAVWGTTITTEGC